jgi:hypothetical protein
MTYTRSPGNLVLHNPFTGIESVLHGRITGSTTCSRGQNAAFISTALRISHSPLFSKSIVLLGQAELPCVTHTRWFCWAVQCYCVCCVFWSLENYISLATVNSFVLNFNTPIPILYREVLIFIGQFTATGGPAAARPMNQYACWPITFRMKELQFTDHRRCWKCCPHQLQIDPTFDDTVGINYKNESC